MFKKLKQDVDPNTISENCKAYQEFNYEISIVIDDPAKYMGKIKSV